MSVTTEQERVRGRTNGRRDELSACIPALREALESERAFRIEQLAELAAADREPAAPARPAGAADALREVDAAIVAGASQALVDIEWALAAMRRGRYGRCEDCGGEVPLAVLRVVPRARMCLDCHLARDTSDPAPPGDHSGLSAAQPAG